MNRTLLLNIIAVFFIGFLFIFSCYGGLPVDFNADHININIRGAEAMSYSDLISLTLNPFTPAWFYPPNGLMEYLRPLEFLGMKLLFNSFHYSLTAFQVVASITNGMLMVLFLLIIFYMTKSLLWAWLGVLLYLSFPSNSFLMLSTFSVDFQYSVSILSTTALVLFGFLTLKRTKKSTFFLSLAGWILAIWFAIKLKSSEKILPLICIAFIILKLRSISKHIGRFRLIVLLAVSLGMITLIVPFRPFHQWVKKDLVIESTSQTTTQSIQPANEKDKQTFSFRWENMVYRTFCVPDGKCSLFTLQRKKIPRSFSENYGFFLTWFFWIGLIASPFIWSHIKKNKKLVTPQNLDTAQHCFSLWFVWLAATIAGFANGLNVYDTRFLNFAYVPSIPILFTMIGMIETAFLSTPVKQKNRKKIIYRALLLLVLIYSICSNYALLVKIIGNFGGAQDATVRAERDVFQDFFHETPNHRTLYERHHELETRAVIVDWYDLPENWFEQAERILALENQIYFYTRTQDSEKLAKLKEAGYAVSFWKRYDYLDAKPLVFKIFKASAHFKKTLLKSKKENAILIYKIRKKAIA